MIKEKIVYETSSLPKSLSPLVDYYLMKRLLILPDNSVPQSYNPQIGRPVPYAIYWFSNAFGFKDNETTNNLALAMVYSSIATTIRDDIIDGEAKQCVDCFRLYNVFNQLYHEVFRSMFRKNSRFWYILAESVREHEEYERWVLMQQSPPKLDPYSDLYLRESSRYFTAVVYPSLAATAMLSGNSLKVERIKRFLIIYGCGWRIFDDFDDWAVDLDKTNYNNSTILHSIRRMIGDDSKLTTDTVLAMLLDEQFIESTISTMLKYFRAARREIAPFENEYLTTFIDDQIDVQHKLYHVFVSRRKKLIDDLTIFFEKARKNEN